MPIDSLSGISFKTEDGKGYYKAAGADTWSPFNSDLKGTYRFRISIATDTHGDGRFVFLNLSDMSYSSCLETNFSNDYISATWYNSYGSETYVYVVTANQDLYATNYYGEKTKYAKGDIIVKQSYRAVLQDIRYIY